MSKDYGKDVIVILSSLQVAIQQAGGCVLTAQRLRSMTAEDLILHLAGNHIRFQFEKPE